MKIPAFVVAGTSSGCGKTTAVAALLELLKEKGMKPAAFKVGPDYIDPSFHSRISGRPCRNLDSWMLPRPILRRVFRRGCEGAFAAVVEGVMGLFDGRSPITEEASTAEVAKILGLPVVLVLDASKLARSAAAQVLGFCRLDPGVKIRAVLAMKFSGARHLEIIRRAVEQATGVPVVGGLPRDEAIRLPERHLGLVPAAEKNSGWGPELRRKLLELGRQWIQLQRLLRAVGSTWIPRGEILRPSLPAGPPPTRRTNAPHPPGVSSGVPGEGKGREGSPRGPIRIGVAMDEAFHFYYPESLEALEEAAARLVFFSPLEDRRLPECDGIYIGGGFPEVLGERLARNRRFLEDLSEKIRMGLPTYAECGGLMLLSRAIRTTPLRGVPVGARDRRLPMAGVLPGEVEMTKRLVNFGYHEARPLGATVLHPSGPPRRPVRGHEFHYSRWVGASPNAYRIPDRRGGWRREGFRRRNLLASYLHLNLAADPVWSLRFVDVCRRRKQ